MFQQMGFGVAAALLIDATIIRSVLLPAVMALLGRWNWYLPRWLDWLPRLQVDLSSSHRAPSNLTSSGQRRTPLAVGCAGARRLDQLCERAEGCC
jgi:uncharacterized membrane protein YdfJ with MMPL/SSD domain